MPHNDKMIEAIESMDSIRTNVDEIVQKAFGKVSFDVLLSNPLEALTAIYREIIKQNKSNYINAQSIGKRLAKQIKSES